MDAVEPVGLFQEGGQVREGVEVEAAVGHEVSVKFQGNTLEGVVWLLRPTARAARTTLSIVVLEDEISDPESQRKALRHPHSTGQAIQGCGGVAGVCARLLSACVLPPCCNALQEIPFILK